MKASEVLSRHQLKRTSCREGIIEVVLSAGEALSENEIRDRLGGHYDRTTFYRSFKTLVEKQIIHRIVVDNQLIKYAPDVSVTHKNHHAHFFCNRCHSVQCMEQLPVQSYRLPAGYTNVETEVLIKGVCVACSISGQKKQ